MRREDVIFARRTNCLPGHVPRSAVFMTFFFLLIIHITAAQNPSRKHMGDKHQAYYDSLKNMKYDRVFPLLGANVYKRGFDIPFPFGIMINSFYGRQAINITNVNIGIKGPNNSLGPANLDNIITFSDVNAQLYNVNLRADVYVFPFLNVYALLSYMPYSKTHVELSEPVHLSAEPKQDGWGCPQTIT
jgi:hypothetical protein